MKRPRYQHKTAIRQAFEDAGYPVRGRAGLSTTKGWIVIRRKKKGGKRERQAS